jgi:Planctomycete cytochrome C/WD domain, G-beta repeat
MDTDKKRNRFIRVHLCASVALAFFPALHAQPVHHINYEDDVRPIFQRRCFGCHNASEMRAGLSLESYNGVLKGGGSGEIIIAGRPGSSLLFKAISHESGAPQMPLGQAKLPDAEIRVIRDWIQLGLLETAASVPKVPLGPNPLDFTPSTLNKPATPVMPESLPALALPEAARANPVTALAASPWAPLLAAAGHERIYLYDLNKRTLLGELPFPEGIPYCLRFSRDGSTLLAAGGKGVQTGKVALYDVRTANRLATIGNETDIVLAADISSDGKLVALGGPGKLVKVYSAPDGKELYQIKKHTDWITAIEFSPDGKTLATGDRSGGILLWDAALGGNAGAFSDHKDSITSLSWRSDGKLLSSASEDGQIIIWNVADGFPLSTISKGHTPKGAPNTYGVIAGGVLGVQFTSDGRLVSVGRDSTIRIWTADGKAAGASPKCDALLTKVAASFDGKLVIAGDFRGRLQLWDGKQLSLLPAPVGKTE